ncbi:MAG: hypothetical protein ACRCV0_06595 [Brevinema sp.]
MLFSFGAFLLVLILFYFSIILLSDQILLKINNNPKFLHINSILLFLEQPFVKSISGYIGLLISLWNFFAPDFGDVNGGFTLIGALVPSIVLFFDALIINPQLRDWIPFLDKFQVKLDRILEIITPVAGWLTLIVGILHALFYKTLFL